MEPQVGLGDLSLGVQVRVRWTPHPVIVTIGDHRDYIRVLIYSYYTTITGWGGSSEGMRMLSLGADYVALLGGLGFKVFIVNPKYNLTPNILGYEVRSRLLRGSGMGKGFDPAHPLSRI